MANRDAAPANPSPPHSPRPVEMPARADVNPYEDSCRRIQVSREKRPLYFYVTLTKKFLVTDDMIELSGLGLAVTTVVTIAEILKDAGFVTVEYTATSLVQPHPDSQSPIPKAKIQMWIRKTANFDELMAAHPIRGNHHGHHGGHDARAHVEVVNEKVETASGSGSGLEAGNTNPEAENGAKVEGNGEGEVKA